MKATDNALQAEVSRVAVWLPPFWAERPAVWFAQAEAQFSLAGISSETTKFFHVISQLDHWCAAQMEDIIISPPEQSPYTTLKAELVRRLTSAREYRIRQLLTLEEMGDRKPSQFLRDLRSLVPDDFLRNIWSNRLPPNIQAMLAFQPEANLDAAARCAFRNTRPTSSNSPPGIRSPSREETASNLCWYHRHFGDRAQKCTQPCAYRQQGN
jgi:hypothetical protein